jgi:putative transposase
MVEKDAAVTKRMRDLAGENPRYGYRRIQVLLAREGFGMSPKRAHRLWKRSKLQVPKKRPRRRVSGTVPRPERATGPNESWAYDFVHDTCANGQALRCLTVVDEFTREALAIEVAGSFRSHRVIDTLARLMSVHGVPQRLRSDNGPEFVATAVQEWLAAEGVSTVYSQPGKPWQNGTNESFNGKFRDECLDAEWFPNRRVAKVLIEAYRVKFNEFRPHSSLQQKTPREFKLWLKRKARQAEPRSAALHHQQRLDPDVKGLVEQPQHRGARA